MMSFITNRTGNAELAALLLCIASSMLLTASVDCSLSVLHSLLSIDASKDAFMRANGAAELQHLAQTATGGF